MGAGVSKKRENYEISTPKSAKIDEIDEKNEILSPENPPISAKIAPENREMAKNVPKGVEPKSAKKTPEKKISPMRTQKIDKNSEKSAKSKNGEKAEIIPSEGEKHGKYPIVIFLPANFEIGAKIPVKNGYFTEFYRNFCADFEICGQKNHNRIFSVFFSFGRNNFGFFAIF
eukprot:TRINITY_DN9_c3_g1_i1.p2 TRINITY_DN9_c3_g1~~TRINITY_DN9_c3_g1_i1.p2  ORF type:complete len:172 (-),score=49.05 TRINITY_DN9_c3_g1_i1:344-859(-)